MLTRMGFALLLALSACQITASENLQPKTPQSWKLLWTTKAEFKSPESAVFVPGQNLIFVSNVNGYERNGKGFISALRRDGSVLKLRWLEGIDAPTGLAVQGNILWAVDFNKLLKIDIAKKRVVAQFYTSNADPGLNDVAVAESGEVFVTGSKTSTVYIVDGDELKVWLKDTENLKFANGIHAGDDHIWVAAYHLARIDRSGKDLTRISDPEVIFDLEGVKPDGAGGHLVSMIGNRPVHRIGTKGDLMPLFSGSEYVADFDISDGMIVAPTGSAEVSAFQLSD